MFMIGCNVEVKVEEGKLTIVCEIKEAIPSRVRRIKGETLATTNGVVDIPHTDLCLDLNLYRWIINPVTG